ncbi:hypothetical protein CDL12_22358 [Handroanthus impetiginosus]|uniref:Multi antimicrobial extrusion protein n=1 Tax=Handroanthus impetiginosus TaxID=429701 RepID=A0A2G9GIS9_9LAMI|nr:hypothetical protein CDL12_22358 [Handroanthus impetiginosus]
MDNSLQENLIVSSKSEQTEDLKGKICEESKKIWRVALPSVVSRVTSFGTIVVTQSFIGHISSTDLAGYALVQTLSVRFVNGIVIGMSSATETLCGQAFGAKQYHMMEDLKGKICEESKKIWRVALPSVVSRVTSFGTIVVTQSFIGHISSTDLAGYALVQTLSVRFVNGIVIGMSSATETLCGQAFGAKQYHMMGIFLQ